MNEKLLKGNEVCATVGFSPTVVDRWVKEKRFPEPIRIMGKGKRWLASEIQTWIEQQVAARSDHV